jgi:AcrR family transcriptional regulator
VTKPVVYDVFANRDDVMTALLDSEQERSMGAILTAIGPAPPAGATVDLGVLLADAVIRALQVVQSRPQAFRLMLLQTAGTPPEVRSRIDAGRETVVEHVRRLLDGVLGGIGADTEFMALSLMAVAEQAALLVLSDPVRFPPERVEAGVRQLCAGVLSSSRP